MHPEEQLSTDFLTLVIAAHNEAGHLAQLLATLVDLPVLVVVDERTTDQTEQIVRRFQNVTAVRHKYESYGKQLNWALAERVQTEWAFVLDADERIADPTQLMRIALAAATSTRAVAFRRRNWLGDRPLRGGGWWPDWQTRLVRKGTFYEERSIHPHFAVEKRHLSMCSSLVIEHLAYRSARHYLEKLSYYAAAEASPGAVSSISHRPRYRRLKVAFDHLPAKGTFRFIYAYIWRAGFRDGWAGYYLALWGAQKYSMIRGVRRLDQPADRQDSDR